jgi:hypothetical protein
VGSCRNAGSIQILLQGEIVVIETNVRLALCRSPIGSACAESSHLIRSTIVEPDGKDRNRGHLRQKDGITVSARNIGRSSGRRLQTPTVNAAAPAIGSLSIGRERGQAHAEDAVAARSRSRQRLYKHERVCGDVRSSGRGRREGVAVQVRAALGERDIALRLGGGHGVDHKCVRQAAVVVDGCHRAVQRAPPPGHVVCHQAGA